MKVEGYELVTNALHEAGVQPFKIDPCPEDGQDIHRFGVLVSMDTTAEQVEDAFVSAGIAIDPSKSKSEQKDSTQSVLAWCNSTVAASGNERRVEFIDITAPEPSTDN